MAAPMQFSRTCILFIKCRKLYKFGSCINSQIPSQAYSTRPSGSTSSAEPQNVPVKSDASTATDAVGYAGADKAQKISRAMKAYLERAQTHSAFMQAEIAEFEIGKRHLANIMGADPDMFTQDDIDRSIEYLFPSSIFEKKARAKMKHPTEILPKRKAAEFGMDGRPFHFQFYTGKPNLFQTMHDIALKIDELNKFEDSLIAKRLVADGAQKLQLSGSVWLDKKVLEGKFQEKLSDSEYQSFIAVLDHLARLECSYREKEFIFQFRRHLEKQSVLDDIQPLKYDEVGRAYQDALGERKEARARLRLWQQGTGKVTINGRELLEVFPRLADREQIMFPLHLVDKLGEVDFEATVQSGGPSGQAGAIRLALSRALQSIIEKSQVEKLRLAGLLTRDPRTVERQKPGQQGARRKYTWKKR